MVIPVAETATPSHWLVRFTSVISGLSNYCVCSNSATTTSGIVLDIVETGDASPVATSGQVRLLPVGDWVMTVWEQTSSTNIDPQNAAVVREVHVEQVRVDGQGEGETGDECPPCDDPVSVTNSDGTYSQTVACGGALALPDVTHTDSDGSPVLLPGMTPFIATSGAGAVDVYYPIAIGTP